MYTERFKIKNAASVEIEIKVLTGDNIFHPDFDYSFASTVQAVEDGKRNYSDIHNLLSQLIEKGILAYDRKEGNDHLFKHIVGSNPNEFKYQRVSVGPVTQPEEPHMSLGDILCGLSTPLSNELRTPLVEVRTLENMLYAVCQANNIRVPYVISPKNWVFTMFDNYMLPAKPDEENNSCSSFWKCSI